VRPGPEDQMNTLFDARALALAGVAPGACHNRFAVVV
jgi:hypothetical protein